MKKLFIAVIVIFSFVLLHSTDPVQGKGKKRRAPAFKGRVIYINNDLVELKWGKRELVFYFAGETKYYSRSWAEKDKSIVEICQVARAYYRKEGNKRILLKLHVLSDSYCK